MARGGIVHQRKYHRDHVGTGLLQDSTFMLRSAALLCLIAVLSGCGIVSTTVGAVSTVGSAAVSVTGAAVDIVTYPLSD